MEKRLIHKGILLIISALVLTACATEHRANARQNVAQGEINSLPDGKAIWQSGLQYVALKSQPGGTPANDQPQDVTPGRLRRLFSHLRIKESSAGKGKGRPLFTSAALDELCPPLSKALSKAQPHEDIAFAVVTRGQPAGQRMLLVHGKQPLLTTGLVFYRKQHLNVIFNRIHAPFEAHYLNTGQAPDLSPGRRDKRSQTAWKILGTKRVTHPHGNRPDWIRFTHSAPKTTRARKASKNAPIQNKTKSKSEYQSIAHRLRILEKLHKNGLITDKEYKEKQQKILNNL